ncbi:MAG: prepilin-type N-terminal cleavage/methylation domain-containing protein, partial [Bacilli bacterium]|nr:prepilin-type N-terminal cleavage/methylation domain-containing protein [Bacilli bacterium]
MKNKKEGFTLIELLAVIIILGVLMIIAIPSVTEYINSSRKSAYITIAQQYISSVKNKVNAGEFEMYDTDVTYYVPTKCVSLEKGGDSPFGAFDKAYVLVTYSGNSYNYYWTSRDEVGIGIKNVTPADQLEESLIESNIKEGEIAATTSIGDRASIIE